MKGKIFYRERSKVGTKEKKPRFRIAAVSGIDLQVYSDHFRMKELEQIAGKVEAELVELKVEPKEAD